MRPLLALAVAALLAGCGADGAPLPPGTPTTTGVTVSGQARIGVATEF
jgi:hypothetical protein